MVQWCNTDLNNDNGTYTDDDSFDPDFDVGDNDNDDNDGSDNLGDDDYDN